MAETVIMPKLGFDMAEGTLVRWVKKPGETVAKGDVLAEIETDKATVEVESPYAGVVSKQLVEQGAVVPVGSPIAIVGEPGEKVDDGALPGGKAGEAEQKPPSPSVEMPAAPEPPKAGEAAPVEQKTAEGGTAPVVQEPVEPVQQTPEAPAIPEPSGPVYASPLARKIAREQGIDLQQITGSGPGGRIVKRDLESAKAGAASQPSAAPVKPAAQGAAAPRPAVWIPAVDFEIPEDELVPASRLRLAIGKRMSESNQQVPDFTVTREYGVDKLAELRKAANESLAEDEKLSYNDFVVKAAAMTLRKFPNLNASLQGDKILRHGHINIGVAVSVEGGLLTVVARDADRKPLRAISAELNGMIDRVTSGKVKPEDIEGSTFSTSNLGMFGVDQFTAIINPPEVAILAVGGVVETAVIVNGEVKPGLRMKMTLSADHRVTDGAETAKFMQALAEYIENPVLLLL